MSDSIRYALLCALCVLMYSGMLSAQTTTTSATNTQDSQESSFSDGTGFFISLGAIKSGASTASNPWYQAPWESSSIDFQTGLNVGAKLAFFNTKNTLGLELKGFVNSSNIKQSDLSMLNYGGGIDGVWQPFKYLGVYAGGGYEQSRYADSIDLRATPQGGYVNAGFRIGYQGLYLDLYYKYSLYQTHLDGMPSFSQSVAGCSVVFPLVEVVAAIFTPSHSRSYRSSYGTRGYDYRRGYFDGRADATRDFHRSFHF